MDEQQRNGDAACKCHTWTIVGHDLGKQIEDFDHFRVAHHPSCDAGVQIPIDSDLDYVQTPVDFD